MKSSNDKQSWFPRARDFRPSFKFFIIGFFLLIIVIILIVIHLSQIQFNNSAPKKTIGTTMLASQDISAIDAKKEPIILLQNWAIVIDGKSYPVFQKGSIVYAKVNNKKVALQNGAIVYRNGQPYTWENGHLVPMNKDITTAHALTGPQAGDIIEKDGKLYRMSGDGKMQLYHAELKPGQIVWKNGEPFAVGPSKSLNAILHHPTAGQFVEKNGKLYRIGVDGKPHLYHGQLKAGNVVWKHGKAYIEGTDGRLHAVGSHPHVGDLVMKHGQLYQEGANNTLHPYLGSLNKDQVVWKHGVPFAEGSDGKLHRLTNGATRTINGKPYYWKNGKWLPYASVGVRPGDLIEKDGKLYQEGADGRLQAYNKRLYPGKIVWKNGKPYRANKNGNLIPLRDGQKFLGTDGRTYMYRDGHIIRAPQKKIKKKQPVPLAGDNSDLEAAYQSTLLSYQNSAVNQSVAKHEHSVHGGGDGSQQAINNLQNQSKSLTNALLQSSNQFASQNSQSSKVAFLKEGSGQANQSKYKLQHPTSPYTLFAGTIIPATLQTGINSDLPGTIIAHVRKNVYDTATGNYLLIPQGTTVYGRYDSSVSYAQKRVLIVFYRLIFPNGTSINLDNMPGADLSGYSGLSDQVDNHYVRLFGSALMFSIFSAAGQLSQPSTSGQSAPSNQQIIYSAVGQELTQTAAKMLEKNMNVQPTIKIRPGDNFNLLTTRDIVFPSWYHFNN
jgi:type IV secretory pathway VirB10-like protein